MKKPKNLLFNEFSSEVFERMPQKILFIYDQEKILGTQNDFINKMKEKFPSSNFTFCNISKTKSSQLSEKYDLVIPIEPYDIDGSVRPVLEQFALGTKMEYFIIYEDTYGYIRLARKRNLLYRLYVQKPFLIYPYILWGFIFIVIPCYVFYFYLVLRDFLRSLFLRSRPDSSQEMP